VLRAELREDAVRVEQSPKVLLSGQFPPDGLVRSAWIVQGSYLPNLVAEVYTAVPWLNF
jgi:hypothetical protein